MWAGSSTSTSTRGSARYREAAGEADGGLRGSPRAVGAVPGAVGAAGAAAAGPRGAPGPAAVGLLPPVLWGRGRGGGWGWRPRCRQR